MLRRTKQSKGKDGELILNLPGKEVTTHLLEAEEAERNVYTLMEQKSQKDLNGFLAKNVLMAR